MMEGASGKALLAKLRAIAVRYYGAPAREAVKVSAQRRAMAAAFGDCSSAGVRREALVILARRGR